MKTVKDLKVGKVVYDEKKKKKKNEECWESMSPINRWKMINRLKKVGYVLISPLVYIPTIIVMAIMMWPLAFLLVTEYIAKGDAPATETIFGYIIYPIWWILEKIWGK